MPLQTGNSAEVIQANIAQLIKEGRPAEQAAAIAYNKAEDRLPGVIAEAQAAGTPTEQPAPMPQASGVIFIAGQRVLLLQRLDGSWGFPAGCAEEGETPYQVACREILEETGHTIDPMAGQVTQIAVVDNPDGFRFTCYMQCVPDVFPVTICRESTGMMWANLDALPAPLFMCCGELLSIAVGAVAMDRADTAREMDGNGFTEIKGNPLSKVGVFQYLGKSIPGADPAKVYNVYRPAEELGSQATLDSIKLTPWVDDHAMVGTLRGAVDAAQKGVHGVIGQDVYFDGDTLYGNLKLFSNEHAARIADGKTPLSLGYRCRYEHAPGVFNGQAYDYVQRQIRGNHIASVDDGRMGPEVAVLDHFSFTFDSKDVPTMADPEKTPAADAAPGAGEAMTLAEITATLKAIAPQVAALTQAMQAMAAPAPAAAVADADKPAAAAPMAAEAMDAAIEKGVAAALASRGQRDQLAAKLSAHVGVFDHSDMTHGDVVAYGLDKLGIKDAPKGAESVYLSAFLAAKPTPSRSGATFAMDAAEPAGAVPAFLADCGIKE